MADGCAEEELYMLIILFQIEVESTYTSVGVSRQQLVGSHPSSYTGQMIRFITPT